MQNPFFHSLPVPVLLLDRSLCIVAANPAADAVLERLRFGAGERIEGRSLPELFPMAAVQLLTWRDSPTEDWKHDFRSPTGRPVRLALRIDASTAGDGVTAVLHDLGPISSPELPAGTAEGADDAHPLLLASGFPVVVSDGSGRLLRCNLEFEQLTGYSEAALRGQTWFTVLSPGEGSPGSARGACGALPEDRGSPVVTRDGSRRWTVWRSRTLPAAGAAGTVTVGLDMTELEEAQEQLRLSAQRNRTLLASLPQRIFFKDQHGRFVLVNRPFARDFGLQPEEFCGKTDADFFPAELAEKYRADDLLVMQSRRSHQLVETNRTAGTTRFVEVVKAPVIGDDGEIQGVLGIFTDISDRKRVEEALAHERDLLHILMDNIPDLIYFKDAHSRFTRVNRAQAQHLGVACAEEAVGKCDGDFYLAPEAAEFFADEQEILRTGVPLVSKAERVTDLDGQQRWLSTTKAPVFDFEGRAVGIVGVGRDITERTLAEVELQRIAADLARSNEELEQFAYVASHDLQEPLRMVASYTQLLARRYQDRLDDDGLEFIRYAVDGATRMQGLIQDLLAYSRVGSRGRNLEPVACAEAVRRALHYLRLTVDEAGAEVHVGTLPSIRGDAGQLTQLFQNLIGNALKFRGEAPPRVRITAERRGVEWLFRVEDNGIGIDPAYAEKIFIIFQRLHGKSEYSGSGIGLSICKKIVTRHGGRIWVESSPGAGAAFCFTIPCYPAGEAGSESGATAGSAPRMQPRPASTAGQVECDRAAN